MSTHSAQIRAARLRSGAAYLDAMIELVPEQYYMPDAAGEPETWSKYYHVRRAAATVRRGAWGSLRGRACVCVCVRLCVCGGAQNRKLAAPQQAVKDASKRAKRARFDESSRATIAQRQVAAAAAEAARLEEEVGSDGAGGGGGDGDVEMADGAALGEGGASGPLSGRPCASLGELRDRLRRKIESLRAARKARGGDGEAPARKRQRTAAGGGAAAAAAAGGAPAAGGVPVPRPSSSKQAAGAGGGGPPRLTAARGGAPDTRAGVGGAAAAAGGGAAARERAIASLLPVVEASIGYGALRDGAEPLAAGGGAPAPPKKKRDLQKLYENAASLQVRTAEHVFVVPLRPRARAVPSRRDLSVAAGVRAGEAGRYACDGGGARRPQGPALVRDAAARGGRAGAGRPEAAREGAQAQGAREAQERQGVVRACARACLRLCLYVCVCGGGGHDGHASRAAVCRKARAATQVESQEARAAKRDENLKRRKTHREVGVPCLRLSGMWGDHAWRSTASGSRVPRTSSSMTRAAAARSRRRLPLLRQPRRMARPEAASGRGISSGDACSVQCG